MKISSWPILILLMAMLIAPANGQGEEQPAVWNVYCNGDRSQCTVAKEPTGELMFNMLGPVTWNTAQDWMNEWRTNNQPAVWYVYCNGDRSKCAIAKEPIGELNV